MYPENAVADSPVTIPRPVFEQIDNVVALIKHMRHNEELREGRLAAEDFDPLGEVCVCSDRVMQVMGWDHATLDETMEWAVDMDVSDGRIRRCTILGRDIAVICKVRRFTALPV